MNKFLPNQTMLTALRCPICHSEILLRDRREQGGCVSLICGGARTHCYDVSSSGYVNWTLPGHTDGGDAKGAVRARSSFLNLGHYRPAADALLEELKKLVSPTDGTVLDAGCGEGYYTEQFVNDGYTMLGFDLSKWAIDTAAKRMTRAELNSGLFGVASVFELPVKNEAVAAVLNIFAPCAEEEFLRVLKPGGILAVVYAGPEHLMGLKRAIYDVTKKNDGRADLPCGMTQIDERRVRFSIQVSGKEHLQDLFAMTPYYWRTSPADSEKLKCLDELETEVDMILTFYQKK